MIHNISTSLTAFRADTHTVNPDTGEYKDPLMHWPVRGAAFTNEVGEALRPLIGNYATLSWVPALLYIGADIYDKYKNDQTEYSPDSRRGLKQAVFQGMASIALPLVAVKGGQNILSLIGLSFKDKITINAQEHIHKIAQTFIANGKMHAYHGRDKECIKEFVDIVNNNLDFKKHNDVDTNPLRKLTLRINKKNNIDNYAEKTIKKLIEMRHDLLNKSDDIKDGRWFKQYNAALKKGQTQNVAVKSVLNKFIECKALKGRFIKTVGGFIALGAAIKPIDHFVENVLIGKIVGPGLDKTKRSA